VSGGSGPRAGEPGADVPARAAAPELPAGLADLPCDAQGPVFAQPWQAQAFAMTLRLHERGLFTWAEWAQRLSGTIRDAQARGDPDLGDTYYEHWVQALDGVGQE
jgi:nitrile hydratase accessory protein